MTIQKQRCGSCARFNAHPPSNAPFWPRRYGHCFFANIVPYSQAPNPTPWPRHPNMKSCQLWEKRQ